MGNAEMCEENVLRKETSTSTDLKTSKSVFLTRSSYEWGNKELFGNSE